MHSNEEVVRQIWEAKSRQPLCMDQLQRVMEEVESNDLVASKNKKSELLKEILFHARTALRSLVN